jgi:hypothetical protein
MISFPFHVSGTYSVDLFSCWQPTNSIATIMTKLFRPNLFVPITKGHNIIDIFLFASPDQRVVGWQQYIRKFVLGLSLLLGIFQHMF